MIIGGATTVIDALEVLPVPPSVEVTCTLLFFTFAVVPWTFTETVQLPLIAWFGIRGIGSIYYLLYATNRGLPDGLLGQIVGLTLATVMASIVLHGISITPLMHRYRRGRDHAKASVESAGPDGAAQTRPPSRLNV